MASDFAPTMLPNAAAVWRSAVEDLSPHASPCRYLTPARWVADAEAAIDFCDRLAPRRMRSAGQRPIVRAPPGAWDAGVEVCGVLMVSGSKALGVEPTRVVFDRGSGYRIKQGQIWGIPVWEFAKKGMVR